MHHPSRARVLLPLIALFAVALAACSSGGASPSPAASPRSVAVTTLDTMRFDPSSFEFRVGETIRFEITNAGTVDHEFYVGTAEEQAAHEEEMKAGHSTHDHENSVSLKPGETKTLELTFAKAGTLEIGCHVPGHWPAGMKGTITIT